MVLDGTGFDFQRIRFVLLNERKMGSLEICRVCEN